MQNSKGNIDVVYVLGSGSPWRNNEMRFSLRSLVKNLKGYRNIYIVGEKPLFVQNVFHVYHPDTLKNNADGNIINKVKRACEINDLSDTFLFINDDHLFLKPIEILDIKPFHKGDMSTFSNKYFELNFWRLRLHRTFKILQEKGLPTYHYDCHVPMLMDKNIFPNVVNNFNYEEHTGYTMKSLYGNSVYKDGVKLNGEKVKVFKYMFCHDIEKLTEKATFLAFNDMGLNIHLRRWLFDNFPDETAFEKDIPDSSLECLKWLGKMEREKGIELYNKFGKSTRIKRFFETKKGGVVDHKLNTHLTKLAML